MQGNIKLSVDIMSGDVHPRLCVCACQNFIERYSDVHLTLVGDANIRQMLSLEHSPSLSFVESHDVVNAHDALRDVIRNKTASSMHKAVALLASHDVHGCISAGNTAALLALGSHLLRKIPKVSRPAIARAMPSTHGSYIMLDLGATVDCTAQQLLEFALMGSAIAKQSPNHKPVVALLSNGSEPVKGNSVLRQAKTLFEACDAIDYAGYIEGDKVFDADVDVVVCDGFVGNVALKVSEGTARFVTDNALLSSGALSWWQKITRPLVRAQLQVWQQQHNPDNYNGALFAGFDRVLVKSHGSASQSGFYKALEFAYEQVKRETPTSLKHYFSQLHFSIDKQN